MTASSIQLTGTTQIIRYRCPLTGSAAYTSLNLLRLQAGQQSYIIFVVRDDSRASDYLFQSSVTTYQAYNNWPGTANGGKSLYEHNSVGGVRAVKVSFNRPYAIEPSAGSTQHLGPASDVGAVVPKPALRWWAQTVCHLSRAAHDDAADSAVVAEGADELAHVIL